MIDNNKTLREMEKVLNQMPSEEKVKAQRVLEIAGSAAYMILGDPQVVANRCNLLLCHLYCSEADYDTAHK